MKQTTVKKETKQQMKLIVEKKSSRKGGHKDVSRTQRSTHGESYMRRRIFFTQFCFIQII